MSEGTFRNFLDSIRQSPINSPSTVGLLSRTSEIGDVFAERGSQVDLMILLIHKDLSDLLCQGELAKGFTLPYSLAVVPWSR